MEIIFIILLFIITLLLTIIIFILVDIHDGLKDINTTIIDIHPGYKYKKVYQSKRYETNIKSY